MSYFHALISQASEPDSFRCVAHDLSETDLKKLVVRPYRSGRPILVGNRVYPVQELRGVKIVKTEEPAEVVLAKATEEFNRDVDRMNNDPSSFVFVMPSPGYTLDQLDEVGTDVTASFVTEAPGEGGPLKLAQVFANHPWVVGIGTAVAAAAIAAWLKLT